MSAGSAVPLRILDSAFALPPERLIAWARLILAGFALVALYLDPSRPGSAIEFVIAGTYLTFAVVWVGLVTARLPGSREQLLTHLLDIISVSLLMYLTEGPTSPFFVFFTFILLSATLRWNWRGALGTAACLVLLFALLVVLGERAEGLEITRAIIRSGYLLVAGAMLGYVGAFEERSRKRLAQLASWPGPDPEGGAPIPMRASLTHAAELLAAPRVLVVWEQSTEPFRHVALWSEGDLTHSRERPDRFGSLVAPHLTEASFRIDAPIGPTYAPHGAASAHSPLLDQDLQNSFAINKALTAPFRFPGCRGRIFLLGCKEETHDDLVITELVAMRLGIDIEHHLLRFELEKAATIEERARLAHDLHDGVLQGLAAANIQLKLTSQRAPDDLGDKLAQTRQLLAGEQERIRTFVEESRRAPRSAPKYVQLGRQLESRLRDVANQWSCEVHWSVRPPDLHVTTDLAHHVRHMIVEAVSNAVRHGGASHIEVTVEQQDARLLLTIHENGRGFTGLNGGYSLDELERLAMGPASLLERSKQLSSHLFLTTSSCGSTIRVEVPF